jgi:hypothetical protein
VEEGRNTNRIFVGRLQCWRHSGMSSRRWRENIKKDLGKVGYKMWPGLNCSMTGFNTRLI